MARMNIVHLLCLHMKFIIHLFIFTVILSRLKLPQIFYSVCIAIFFLCFVFILLPSLLFLLSSNLSFHCLFRMCRWHVEREIRIFVGIITPSAFYFSLSSRPRWMNIDNLLQSKGNWDYKSYFTSKWTCRTLKWFSNFLGCFY